MSNLDDYDKEVEAIRAYNQPILDAFQGWLKAAGLADRTINNHVENIDFFTEYLTYYEPLYRLDEADAVDIMSFSLDWFPRKAMWASVGSAKSNIASFRKFFKFMGETGRLDDETVSEVLETLKERRDDFLEAVEDDDFGDWW